MVEKLELITALPNKDMKVLEVAGIGIEVLIGIGGDQGLREGEGDLDLILEITGEGLEVEVMIDDEDRCCGPFRESEREYRLKQDYKKYKKKFKMQKNSLKKIPFETNNLTLFLLNNLLEKKIHK